MGDQVFHVAKMRLDFLLVGLLLISYVAAFYLPGVSPVEYFDAEEVPLKVNKMVSSRTQIPYPYYSLNFCKPEEIKDVVENLGEILMGDKIENSPYVIEAGVSVPCKVLCQVHLTPQDSKLFSKRIQQEYRINWILDNLPAATKQTVIDFNGDRSFKYETGFPLGKVDTDGRTYLHNHIAMNILYHTSNDFVGRRIVGFEVEPQSIHHSSFNVSSSTSLPDTCMRPIELQEVSESLAGTVVFTYSVDWEFNQVKWSSRWDIYLTMTDTRIHWFSIVNSLLILLFLSGMVAMIMMRALHSDIRNYRDMEPQEEETGWKLVHGDVFRPPPFRIVLSVLLGSGIQIFAMVVITLIFALLGFLSPANRGGLMTAVVILFMLMAFCSGYTSARMYKIFKGTSWKKNSILTATLLPGTIFIIFFFLNIILGFERSSGYVHFVILLGIVFLWFLISIPLCFYGSYLGYKRAIPDPPVRTNQIPRQIPEQVWYMRPTMTVLMGGILPFGAVFIELFFIMTSIWQHQFYYMFGVLFIVYIILAVTCAEITIVMCYFQLCAEDYRWWWRSFLTAGASAFYLFLYSVWYYWSKLNITGIVPTVLYFAYMIMVCITFSLITGAVGLYSCLWFVKKIYGAIK